jgi:hypothetical protein
MLRIIVDHLRWMIGAAAYFAKRSPTSASQDYQRVILARPSMIGREIVVGDRMASVLSLATTGA